MVVYTFDGVATGNWVRTTMLQGTAVRAVVGLVVASMMGPMGCDYPKATAANTATNPPNKTSVSPDPPPDPCEQPGASCFDCACEPGLTCAESGKCVALVNEGEPCQSNDECRTGNCSDIFGVCRLPIGAACTPEDCDECLINGETTFCSRECSGNQDCGDHAYCMGNATTQHFFCRPRCASAGDPSCSTRCYSAGNGGLYCDISSRRSAPRPFGASCYYDDQCASEDCLNVFWCNTRLDCDYGAGYCSSTCEADEDCREGMVCASIACVGDATEDCGNKCVVPCSDNNCDVGKCHDLIHVSGSPITACDTRVGDGQPCLNASACRSGLCENYECLPEGGKPNGGTCGAPSDCVSNSCVAGTCRGSALLGDACSSANDCAVGTCCDGVCCDD